MKCQILFSGKNKKNISKCRLLKILPRVLSFKKDQERTSYGAYLMMLIQLFFSDFLYKSITYVVGTHLNCITLWRKIKLCTNNICFYK